ncbi:MAG: Holliday junction branch migration protein RuvA [Verrucomicrobiales bacterium]
MIAFLRGKITESLPSHAVVDVGGVGYHVFIPLSTFDRLGEVGGEATLLTHLIVRENEHALYGFATEAERDLFRLLIGRVSGVGPKVAVAVLSGMSVDAFKSAVVNSDVASLAQIKGLGKKTAERIVLELKDKVGVVEAWEAASAARHPSPEQRAANDVVLALIALDYKQVEALKAVKAATAAGTRRTIPKPLLREALRLLKTLASQRHRQAA